MAIRTSARGNRHIVIPTDQDDVALEIGGHRVQLTNLRKPFWQTPLITKGRLLQHYADVAEYLLPHLHDRAMVMKRYPNGADGDFFFMKRKPPNTPEWIETCSIEHNEGKVIDFPMVQDLASLLWVVNLGCIDLNQWYARCDDVDRPDVLHFDLDPFEGATFRNVCETALLVREALTALGMPAYAKTTGSRGIHVYVPIVRGPTQKEVWGVAKQFSLTVAAYAPNLITAEYRIAKRPKRRVLLDYNQNAWGRTLASVYSVRPRPRAPVSTPVEWEEIERGIEIDDFRIDNIVKRLNKLGDLWAPLTVSKGRFDLGNVLGGRRSVAAEVKAAPAQRRDNRASAATPPEGLREYQRKRRFDVTPEPPPAPVRPSRARHKALRFVIQKHRATRLHYDFRLEWDGVLLSWAVPKGPSLDPSVKRLAMMVEDHPIEYAKFEGIIPAGEYGGGTVMVWDEGTYQAEQADVGGSVRKGELKFALSGKKLHGSWVLVRTRASDNRAWLLIKHRDPFASDSDVATDEPRSVISKRLMAEIAFDEGGNVETAAGADPVEAIQALIQEGTTKTRKPRKTPKVWQSKKK